MKKNVASQVIGVQMITAADGTAFTGTVTVVITVDGGTQSASGGTGPTHEGNGFHSYVPTQAETNGDHVAFTFTGTGAIPATVQVYTTFPQTGDTYALANGATGFVAIDTVVDSILGQTGTTGVVIAAAQTVATVTTLTNLPAITANWLTDAGIAATALNGKGDWNVGKTGYTLTATTGLGNQTANITGNLSGSVGSVTGAVGSVTGAVGSVAGNVDGSTASVTGAVGSVTGSVGSLGATAKTDVNAEVLDVLNADTFAEPGQGAPGATVSLAAKIGFLYKAWRNKSTQTATTYSLFNDDTTTVDHKATVSDDATTATKGEVATGP